MVDHIFLGDRIETHFEQYDHTLQRYKKTQHIQNRNIHKIETVSGVHTDCCIKTWI